MTPDPRIVVISDRNQVAEKAQEFIKGVDDGSLTKEDTLFEVLERLQQQQPFVYDYVVRLRPNL